MVDGGGARRQHGKLAAGQQDVRDVAASAADHLQRRCLGWQWRWGQWFGAGSGLGSLVFLLYRWREGPGWPREDACVVLANINFAQIWSIDGSVRANQSLLGRATPLR
jgi:hypothetical protein